MAEKIAIVTGGNKGIGWSIVKFLCQQFDGAVYLTARDKSRGEEAVKKLEEIGLHPKFHLLDTDSVPSIVAFTDFIRKTHGGIDVLVNNAAIAYGVDATEPFSKQAEDSMRVNFTGTLNVCENLFPLLRNHARVVHVSSSVGHLSKISGKEPEASQLRSRFSDPKLTQEELIELANSFVALTVDGKHNDAGWPNSAYGVSKVALSAVTRIHQRQFNEKRPDDDILVNAVHPGYVDTDMSSHKGVLTPDEGAQAPVWAALLPPGTKEPSGGYIWSDKQIVDWVNGPTPTPY